MLSTQHTSSIDKRRQLHRRQQSLETNILAHQTTANAQYQRNYQQAHRRGISLDQGSVPRPLSIAPHSPQHSHGTPPPQRHDIRQYQAGLQVSIPGSDTGYQFPSDTQHIMQATQQQRTGQPGHTTLDFQAHLQQQANGRLSPATTIDAAEEAKQKLLDHINWFQATYSEPVSGLTVTAQSRPTSTFQQLTTPLSPEHSNFDLSSQLLPQQQQQHHRYTPVNRQSQTVPNTPQRAGVGAQQSLTGSKHNRSQSFQYDAAPLSTTTMGDIFDYTSLAAQSSRPSSVHDTVVNSYDHITGDQSYASSMYSSSIADPLSPACHYNASVMPTVQEEGYDALDQGMIDSRSDLFDHFDDLDTDDDDNLHAPQPYSPRQAALIALGDINASIEETGVSSEQVNQFMSGQDDGDAKWTCLYPECGKKFGRKENIRAHIQTHLGDRQFKCNDCGKCFVRQHDLKRHAKIHSGVKPNVCPCGMSFARQDALTRHRQRGTCHGVLPGFEKTDDSRKKRGRPRKERPDLESRIDKATRSRRWDAARAAGGSSPAAVAGAQRMGGDELAAIMSAAINQSSHYDGSSESGASDHDSPFTPAPSSEMDDLLFNDFVTGNAQADCIPFSMRNEGPWLVDTPPTSPASFQMFSKTIAPAMLSDQGSIDGSSPASMDDVELALLAWRGEEHTGVVF